MVLDYLKLLLPAQTAEGTKITKNNNAALGEEDAGKLNSALTIKKDNGEAVLTPDFKGTDKIKDVYANILDTARQRLSANKYNMLTEMVNTGVLRLIVESGELETKLTFRTWGTNSFSETKTEYDRESKGSVGASGILSTVFFGPKLSKDSHIIVNTSNTKTTSNDSAYTSIYGGVKLHFKTDYIALSR